MTTEPQDEVFSDSSKACLSLFYFACAIILPIIGFLIGWQGWDLKTGGYVALATFSIFILFSGIFIAIVQSPSWIMVAAPLVIGILYAAFPDPILGPFDDVAVNLGGAFVTFLLWAKKQPDLPRWVIFPLLATGVYAAAGYFIPGPFDEIIVALIAVTIAAIGAANGSPSEEEEAADSEDDALIIDVTLEHSTGSDYQAEDELLENDPAAIEAPAPIAPEDAILIPPLPDENAQPQAEDPLYHDPGVDEQPAESGEGDTGDTEVDGEDALPTDEQ